MTGEQRSCFAHSATVSNAAVSSFVMSPQWRAYTPAFGRSQVYARHDAQYVSADVAAAGAPPGAPSAQAVHARLA